MNNNTKLIAARWAHRHPELAARLGRALEIIEAGDVAPGIGTTYKVKGSRGTEYLVTLEKTHTGARCTCPDASHRAPEGRCKHLLACSLLFKTNSLPQ